MTALPKGEPRHRILAQEMERICIDTLHSLFYGYPSMRVPPESRMVVKRFPSGTPCLSLWERWPAQRGRRGQITATSIGKCWHLRRQMTSRGRKALSVTCGDSSPKGSQGIVYWHKKSIRSIIGYPSMRVPPESRMVVKRFPVPLPVGEVRSK